MIVQCYTAMIFSGAEFDAEICVRDIDAVEAESSSTICVMVRTLSVLRYMAQRAMTFGLVLRRNHMHRKPPDTLSCQAEHTPHYIPL